MRPMAGEGRWRVGLGWRGSGLCRLLAVPLCLPQVASPGSGASDACSGKRRDPPQSQARQLRQPLRPVCCALHAALCMLHQQHTALWLTGWGREAGGAWRSLALLEERVEGAEGVGGHSPGVCSRRGAPAAARQQALNLLQSEPGSSPPSFLDNSYQQEGREVAALEGACGIAA
jgi:hypothetical protein